MSDQQAKPKTAFTCFWLMQRAESWYHYVSPSEQPISAIKGYHEFLKLLQPNEDDAYQIRGVYSCVGLSARVDLMIWAVADTLDVLQRVAANIGNTNIGRYLRMREVYYGLGGMSKYDPTHGPSFVKGDPALRYLSVYPFTKTHEWFMLPFQERRDLMIEHGKLGRDYPSVQTNTVTCFGIHDAEWIVALEDDDPEILINMVQKLREARVREWTAVDTPVYLGERKPAHEVLADLG